MPSLFLWARRIFMVFWILLLLLSAGFALFTCRLCPFIGDALKQYRSRYVLTILFS